ncbi:MAG TPA: decarboxylating 6-phosphogluconate dehydrogenase [Micropepsaceae bacterium]|nr:decarboxylating 6-phosphogluconate dehydrogenase [Micropepsaceae bacterium]
MEIGVVGLGRMGANIARRLMRHGHSCAVYDRNAGAVEELAKEGAKPARGLSDLVKILSTPRAVWIMLPSGRPTDDTIAELGPQLAVDDILIDGGNSFYRDDIRRARALKKHGVRYVDVGTSGGIWGLERGYCLMIGGEEPAVKRLEPIFEALAPGKDNVAHTPERKSQGSAERGYLHCGPTGSGHFVKMIHNGIEYGLMEAYAEGFDILQHADSVARPEEERYSLDLSEIAEVWRHGSVISSWLLDLTASALAEDQELARFAGTVEDSGEGRWTVDAATQAGVPAEVLSAALYARFRSRGEATYANKLLSAMRNKFGGHVETKPGRSS